MIEWLNQYGALWGEYFAFTVIQNTVFLGLVLLAIYFLRNESARIRYGLGLIGLAKLILPPLIPAPFFKESLVGAANIGILPVQPVDLPVSTSVVLDRSGFLFLSWIVLGTVYILVSLFLSWRLQFKMRSARRIQTIREGKRVIQVLISDKISMPMTYGLLPNKIIVPPIWEQWKPACRQMILNHEIAHIKRRDGLMQFFQIVVQAIYFFHPLVWLLTRKMNELREMACDDMSIGQEKSSSVEYSRYLVEIAENMVQTEIGCSSASALIRQKNELLNRVKYQMEETMKSRHKWRIGVFCLLMLSMAALSWTKGKPDMKPEASAGQKEMGKIAGQVTDRDTGVPLPATNIVVSGTKQGAAANADGQFWIPIEGGTYDLQISRIGYQTVFIKGVQVKADETVRVNPAMKIAVIDASGLGDEAPPPPPPPPPPPADSEDKITFIPYDKPPGPVGGYNAIQQHLVYPEIARKAGIEGRVLVYVQVDENGKVRHAKVQKSLGPNGCDEAAIKAVESVEWEPAMQRDQPVTVWIAVPVDFRLGTEREKSLKPVSEKALPDEVYFTEYDEAPRPVGGYAVLGSNLVYPEEAKKAGIQGKVEVYAHIGEKGQLLETKIFHSLDPECDEAALRVVQGVQWLPAKKDDKPVATWIAIPFEFKMH